MYGQYFNEMICLSNNDGFIFDTSRNDGNYFIILHKSTNSLRQSMVEYYENSINLTRVRQNQAAKAGRLRKYSEGFLGKNE